MDLNGIKKLLLSERPSDDYIAGVKGFLQFAYIGKNSNAKIRCPCVKCVNRMLQKQSIVYDHLICNGMLRGYTIWGCHGETASYISANKDSQFHCPSLNHNMRQVVQDAFGYVDNGLHTNESGAAGSSKVGPDAETQEFFELLRDADQPLWEGCELSKLSFLVLLFNIKSINKWSNKSLNDLLAILQLALPNGSNIPRTFVEARKIIAKLGLRYDKIHVCPNNCQLYRNDKKDHDFCSKCGASRWKGKADNTILTKKERRKAAPNKVMRYFPIKPRLKRLFLHKETARLTRWHDEERTKDGALRHPADSEIWNAINTQHPDFALDSRNMRFGLATDGFNPYGKCNSTHSCWPVVLVPYNLPPWLCMKASSLMLTLIITGYPGKDFHTFMQPVYDELNELFDIGMPTYDASRDEVFQLRAILLYTVSDYPGAGILAQFSTNSQLGCLSCEEETSFMHLKHGYKQCYMGHRRFLPAGHEFRYDANSFDGTEDHRSKPTPCSGEAILEKIKSIRNFENSKTWKGVGGLFCLSYWKYNLLRHNLDFMHIEKNVCENTFGTLLEIEGKSKDNLQARKDLQEMNIRLDLHPQKRANDKYYLPPALYNMSKEEKRQFCKVLHDIKVPDGYSSNISRCVNVAKTNLSGLKSHDCHILMQQLLPVALRGLLPDDVTSVLFDLCGYFRELNAKVLYRDQLEKLEERIIMTLCRMEMIFPPGFFTMMVHLVLHLATEAKIGGPVCYRSMYFVERYTFLYSFSVIFSYFIA